MPLDIGAPSVVAELSRTVGTGPYILLGALPRSSKFSEFFATGETFSYAADNGGGLAEYGTGALNLDGSIGRVSIDWSTNGGRGGSAVSWPAGARQYVRATVTGGSGGGTSPARTINGFWVGTLAGAEKIERYLFVETGTLLAGLIGSRAIASVPAAGSVDQIVTETGDFVVDGVAAFLFTATAGNFVVTDLSDHLVTETGDLIVDSISGSPVTIEIRKNGTVIGTMTFDPGATNADLSLPSSVSCLAGDLLELVGPLTADPNLADIVWTFLVS